MFGTDFRQNSTRGTSSPSSGWSGALAVRVRWIAVVCILAGTGGGFFLFLNSADEVLPHFPAVGGVIGAIVGAFISQPARGVHALRNLGKFLGPASLGIAVLWFRLFATPQLPELLWEETLIWGIAGLFSGLGLAVVLGAVFDLPSDLSQGSAGGPGVAPGRPELCQGCGEPVLHPALLQLERRAFRQLSAWLCPRCQKGHRRREIALAWWLFAAFTALGAVLAWLMPGVVTGWILLNLSLTGVFVFLLVTPHELGHALGGWLVGAKCYSIHIGHGLSIFRNGRWGLFREPNPWRGTLGFASFGFPDMRCLRTRLFLTILAGPVVNALLLLVFFWQVSFGELRDQVDNPPPGMLPGLAFAAANAFILISSLCPLPSATHLGTLPTDGTQLLLTPFLRLEYLQQLHATYFVTEAKLLIDRAEFHEARKWCDRGLSHYPDCAPCLYMQAYCLYRVGQVEEARTMWRNLAIRCGHEPNVRLAAEDALVLLKLFQLAVDPNGADRTALLDESDCLNRGTLKQVRNMPSATLAFLRTRGAVLVEAGRLEEGTALLHRLLVAVVEPFDEAFCYCFLGLAAAQQGDSVTARRFLDQARSLDPSGPFLAPISRRVSSPA